MSLIVENISKNYGKQEIIRCFSCEIKPGEIVILLGKSGTGKTTFMRLINGLERADRGTIRLEDTILCEDNEKESIYPDRAKQRQYQNKIGMVFQNYELFPNLTVLENLLEAPLAQKLDKKEVLTAQAVELLQSMDLENKKNVYPSTLSGGQKQRVAIARAMMLSPEIICFDEPTSALDRESADQVGTLIQEITSQGKGILIVTHDTVFGEQYGTRIISSSEFIP